MQTSNRAQDISQSGQMKQGKARVRNPNNVFESVKEQEGKRYKGNQMWGGEEKGYLFLLGHVWQTVTVITQEYEQILQGTQNVVI